MESIPSGTVILLFTDIQGSTSLFEKYPDAMAQALARHHTILRDAITSHHGYVFQIIGDAFSSAFDSAFDALSAALTAQRALQAEPWGETGPLRVRMGVHSGAVEMHAEDVTSGQYAGYQTLARAQRVMAAAYGGQVLLSGAAMELARVRLPDGVSLRDLGEQRLKGIPQPEHLWQMVAADLPDDFPPLQSLESTPNNLPAPLTTFIGREKEIAQLKQMLAAHRLVTLTGSGGVGKTRLAIEVGRESLPLYRNGVWLVELAAYSDPALVPQAVAAVFELREESGRPAPAVVADYLRHKTLLLILDNCEHMIDASAQLAQHLLRHCPDLRILASSREALSIEGEVDLRVPSLSLPPADQTTPATLAASEAARLFVQRATAVAPAFVLSDGNAPAIAQICRRLDGIPLAIELAASRVKLLSVEQIAARLDDAFRLLTGGSRTAVPRQQTLRALIDWSYNLLSQQERALLRRLSVFMGGWTLGAAEAVCPGDGIAADEVLDVLGQLVDKSLVVVEPGRGGETRYLLLETIRQYAREKLLEAGEDEHLRQRHLAHCCRLVEQAVPNLHCPAAVAWMDRLEQEHNNLRAALGWALETDVQAGLRLANGLWWFWATHSYFGEGVAWNQKLLAAAGGVAPDLRARALGGAGWLVFLQGNLEQAQSLSEQSIILFRELGDKLGTAVPLEILGLVAHMRGDYERAIERMTESLDLFRAAGLAWGVTYALSNLGFPLAAQGDTERAESCLRESLRLAREMGEEDAVAWVLFGLAGLAEAGADYERAMALYSESLAIARRVNDRWVTRMTMGNMTGVAMQLGQLEQATAWAEEAVAISRDYGEMRDTAGSLRDVGWVSRLRGDWGQAAAACAESLALARQMKDVWQINNSLLAIADLGGAHEQRQRSARLAGAVNAWYDEVGSTLSASRRVDHERVLATVHAALGEEAFAAAWQAGQAMTLEQAVSEATDVLAAVGRAA